jgi:hypothetical protein
MPWCTASRRLADEAAGERSARAFAQPHVERQQRRLAERRQHAAHARRLGGAVAGDAVVEARGGLERVQDGGGGGHHIAVEKHGDALRGGRR